MHFVMATKAGDWATACEAPSTKRHVILVMALEGEIGAPKPWCVNEKGVEVERGLVVGFHEVIDANHFLETPRGHEPRACRVSVAAGDIVAFHEFDHAHWFVETERAQHLTEAQVQEIVAARQAGLSHADAEVTSEPVEAGAESAPKPRGRKGKG